jgi:hypothetical protein
MSRAHESVAMTLLQVIEPITWHCGGAIPAAASLVYLQREVERIGSSLVYLYCSKTYSCLLVLNAQQILACITP